MLLKLMVTFAPAETLMLPRLKDMLEAVSAMVVGNGVEVVAGGVETDPVVVVRPVEAVEAVLDEQAPDKIAEPIKTNNTIIADARLIISNLPCSNSSIHCNTGLITNR